MIGRAALRPWIFRDIARAGRGEEKRAFPRTEVGLLMLHHLDLNIVEFGERRGVILMRRALAWYSRGLPGAGLFRRSINELETPEALRATIAAFAG
jgi:tRNA-dihydrouridine synthase B